MHIIGDGGLLNLIYFQESKHVICHIWIQHMSIANLAKLG
jgi:hypothetical protein